MHLPRICKPGTASCHEFGVGSPPCEGLRSQWRHGHSARGRQHESPDLDFPNGRSTACWRVCLGAASWQLVGAMSLNGVLTTEVEVHPVRRFMYIRTRHSVLCPVSIEVHTYSVHDRRPRWYGKEEEVCNGIILGAKVYVQYIHPFLSSSYTCTLLRQPVLGCTCTLYIVQYQTFLTYSLTECLSPTGLPIGPKNHHEAGPTAQLRRLRKLIQIRFTEPGRRSKFWPFAFCHFPLPPNPPQVTRYPASSSLCS